MDYHTLHREVVSHFPSASFRKQLKESGHEFAPKELLAAIYQFVPRFTDRIRLISALADTSPEAAEHARLVVRWQSEILDWIRSPEPGMVYELTVRYDPHEEGYTYLCGDYETCFQMMDAYHRDFEFLSENGEIRYYIRKRRIYQAGQDPDELFDTTGEVSLGPDREILRVYRFSWGNEFGRWDEAGDQVSIEEQYPPVSAWFENGAAVKFTLADGSSGYAIALTSEQVFTDCPDCYLIPLDSEMPRHLDEETFEHFRDHEHVCSAYVEVVTQEELPDELRDSYLGLHEYLTE